MLRHLLDRYRKSLRLKIMVPALVIIICVVAVLASFAVMLMRDSLRHTVLGSATRHAALLANDQNIVASTMSRDVDELDRVLSRVLNSTESAVAAAVYGRNESRVYQLLHEKVALAGHRELFPSSLTDLGEHIGGRIRRSQDDVEILTVTAPVWMPRARSDLTANAIAPVGAVRVAYTFEIAGEWGDGYLEVILLISICIALFGALATDRVTTRLLRPLSALNRGLQRISEGHLEHRIEIFSEDEIGSMAVRFNGMAERLAASQAEIRQHARLLEHKVEERTSELQEACLELQTLDQARDGFVSSVSHEMRTPLTSILASVEILEEFADNDPAARREFLQIIHREANRMLGLVVDVLDLAKIQARTMQLELEEIDLYRLVSGVVDSMHAAAKEAGIAIALQHRGRPITCRCDAERIRRVVRSLMHNAIKFSPRGATVDISFAQSAHWATVSVRDRGPGVLEEERQQIFGLFSDTRSGSDRATHGIGLGLPISKKIAAMHGGDLRYEDPGGEGARFVLSLPLLEKSPRAPAPPAPGPEPGLRAAGGESSPLRAASR